MTCEKLSIFLIACILSGCSVVAYTPVITSSVVGFNKTDLSNNPEYQKFTKRPFQLAPTGGASWQLKKFEGGRYHIELSVNFSNKEVICDLDTGRVVIDEIFDDSIAGGIFYSAEVSCKGHVYKAPLNHWSGQLRDSISFLE